MEDSTVVDGSNNDGVRRRKGEAEADEREGVKTVYAQKAKREGTAYTDDVFEVQEDDESIQEGLGRLQRVKKRVLEEIPTSASLYLTVKQNLRDIRRNKLTFLLGFLACFIVVFVVGLMVSILSHTPVVFLRLAEAQEGEIDLILEPHHTTGFDFINYTMVRDVVSENALYSYSTPRHVFTSKRISELFTRKQCSHAVKDLPLSDWAYTGYRGQTFSNCTKEAGECFRELCGNGTYPHAYLMNSAKEEAMGLGKYFPRNGVDIPLHTVYMSRDMADDMDVKSGDEIFALLDLKQAFKGLWNRTADEYLASDEGELFSVDDARLWQTVIVPFTVAYRFKETFGKTDIDEETAIYVEYDSFLENLNGFFHPKMPDAMQEAVLAWDLQQYAGQVIVNYPPDQRYEAYTDSDMDVINRRFVDFTSDFCFALGFQQTSPEMPVLDELQTLQLFSLFMGLILNVITFILLFLSILLIYSLLMISVETRTFELGIYRMIGMSRGGVIQLLLVQAFTYALPAWVAGVILAEVATVLASYVFQALTGLPLSASLTLEGFLYATVLGIVIPIISSILPISNALGQNLHDAIDVQRSKTKAVEVHVERSEDGGVSWPLLLIGAFLAIFGFTIYYVIPLALLSEKLTILLNVFFALLIMMLLGLVVLSLNVQQLLEKAVVHLFFWFDEAAVRILVLKNLVAHRKRNRKTTIMYALSLGFIIFIYVSYDVQMKSIVYQEMEDAGTFLSVTTNWPNYIDNVAEFESYARRNKDIEAFTWRTHNLESVVPNLKDLELTTLGHVYSDYTNVYGIAPNFFEVMLPDFLVVNEMDDKSAYSLEEQLYTPLGSSSALVGSLYKTKFTLRDLSSQFLIEASYSLDKDDILTDADRTVLAGVEYFRMRPSAFLDGCPAFYFSQFPTQPNQHLLVSFTTFMRMSSGVIRSMDALPVSVFHIKLPTDASDHTLDSVKSDLKDLVGGSRYSMRVYDYRKDLEPLDDANLAMDFFFGFTVIMAMAISFFSLMSSMYTNILEQAKEIGVLRALGVPSGWLQRIFVYEAFTVVFSASAMGMVIGVVVGWTVALQRVLFTELPVPFEFPFTLFGLMVAMAAVFAVISAYSPIAMLTKKPVVSVLRMLT